MTSCDGGTMDDAEKPGLRLVEGDEPWVTADVVAKACGLHPKTIHKLADYCEGFPVIRVGSRHKRYVVAEVKDFIRRHPERLAEAAAMRSLKAAKRRGPKREKGDA